jgi:hypothetical protein
MANRGTVDGDILEQEIRAEMWVTFTVEEFLDAAEAVFSEEELRKLRTEITKMIKNKSQEVKNGKTNLPGTEEKGIH